MFDQSSRYYHLETATHTTMDGRTLAYKRRRFLPRGEGMPLLGEVKVVQGDRLDLIAARTLGDPLHFWRICDANNGMNPPELTEEPGATLRIPVPQP
jgi:hypothetical protein